MAELYRFFDSRIDDVREYTADEFAEYFRMVLTSGIYNGGTNLKVSAPNADLTVNIAEGYALINGYMYKLVDGLTLQLANADTAYDRIDRVVLRWDLRDEARYIKAFVLTGTPAENPEPPAITREGEVFELSLAQVTVPAGKNFVDNSNVADERLNTEVCGLINSLIQADTTEIFDQFQAWYEARTTEYEGKWNSWYNSHIPDYEEKWRVWFAKQQSEDFILDEEKAVPFGVATLDANGKVPLNQLEIPEMVATNVTIKDAGNYYSGSSVELALQEIASTVASGNSSLIASVNKLLKQ